MGVTAGEAKAPDGRQLRWRAHNQARRQKIIDAAIAELEAQDPGAEVHVQQIADRAGLSRTVIYRHFQDRGDLDLAVQRAVIERLGLAVLPAATPEGRPIAIIRRIVDAYVRWAVEHPGLHRVAERGIPSSTPSPVDEILGAIAAQVETIMKVVVDALGVTLSDDDRSILDPWVLGIVGGCFASVRRWTGRPVLVPGVDAMVDLMTASIWFQISGMAASRGIDLPDLPVEELAALPGQADA